MLIYLDDKILYFLLHTSEENAVDLTAKKFMIKKIAKIFLDKSFLIFLAIGVFNTLLSISISFALKTLGFGYWGSTAPAYVICSVLSYILNKKYSFQNKGNVLNTIIKFSLVIAVCYLIAYSLAQPIVKYFLNTLNLHSYKAYTDYFAIFIGQVIFTLLNYIGQRFFAFKKMI
jgi:putative flippase GtrA